MTNPQGSKTSSLFSEDVRFTDERQVGVRKMDHMTGFSGMKLESVASSPYRGIIHMDPQITNGFLHPESYAFPAGNGKLSFMGHAIGAERMASHSLPTGVDQDLKSRPSLNTESVPYFSAYDKQSITVVQHENSLFSSSLSDVFSRNLKISSNHAGYSQSTAATDAVISHYDEGFDSLEELEAQTIGNLLPDDDELFSGVTDGFGTIPHLNDGEETEDLDLFSNVGGLELGDDDFSQKIIELSDVNSHSNQTFSLGSCGGEHPLGEHPSRTLFVRNIHSNVEDSELSALFEQYGAIRTLYTASKHRGFVMISYYDIRAACNAMKALQHKTLRHRNLDVHFSISKENPSEKDINQGTLAILNLDSSVKNDDLLKRFSVYGEVKEIFETPQSPHRYVEFYDVRAAEMALHALNRSEISGKQINLEPAAPGGSKRFTQLLSELEKKEPGNFPQKQIPYSNLATGFTGSLPLGITMSNSENGKILGSNSTNAISNGLHVDHLIHPGVSSSISNTVPSLLRTEPTKLSSISDSSHLRNHLKFNIHGSPDFHAHSLPNNALPNGHQLGSPGNLAMNFGYQTSKIVDGQQFCRVNPQPRNLQVFGSPASGNCPPGTYIWNNSCHPQPQAIPWSNSPSYVNRIGAIPPQQMHLVHKAPHIVNSVLPLNNHHVGSAPSINPNLWDRRHAYAGESPDATAFHPGSLGNMRLSGNSPHPLDFVPRNGFPRGCVNGMDMSKSIAHHQRCMLFPGRGQMLPMLSSLDSPNERSRNRRNEGNLSQGDNRKQFELDLDRIVRGEDKRTTLMIKNIPNKYTSKMLLAAIDERHKGTYDFIYLPIDFKNKCNVGYAFINMTEPSLIVPFHKTFDGKKWEKFNSEKVAYLAYARIQGKAALIAHFQNSSLMNEDKRCRPILFNTDGPNAGDQVPFPMGTNIRPRLGKYRTSPLEENAQDNSSLNGDSSSGSD